MEKDKKDSDEDDSDLESVASEEFEQYLLESTDFASEVKSKSKAEKKKKKSTEEDDGDADEDDHDEDIEEAEIDSEEDFDNDDEFQDAFKDFDDMLKEDPGEVSQHQTVNEDESSDEGEFREEDVEFSNGWYFEFSY